MLQRLLRWRFDGVEALVFAMAFVVVVATLAATRTLVAGRALGCLGLGAGAASVIALRVVRPSRETRARDGVTNVGSPRSLLALLLLGVGWFVIVAGVLALLVVVAMLSDPKGPGAQAAASLLVPACIFAVGVALVLGGMRVGRTKE